jgi:hypothetical protein
MLIYPSGKPFVSMYIVLYSVSKETKVIYSLERKNDFCIFINFDILTKSFIDFYFPILINMNVYMF